jgi:transcriptional regulator with XRE-family HTH domain
MPKTKPRSEIRAMAKPEVQARAKAEAEAIAAPLRELRPARAYTQETIAEILSIRQPEVSKIERRADMDISTLRRSIEATGGRLDITAHFPDGDVVVINFAPEPDADDGTLSVA